MSDTRIHITQGQHAVSAQEDAVITTLLGSCVSCCLWDPLAGVGGMNHMLLTVQKNSDVACNHAGVNAMEVLINDLIKLGANRFNLRAKAFGGAQMIAGLSDVGQVNANFALNFLESEGIVCEGHSFGGNSARNIRFWPFTGRVLQRMTSDALDEPKTVTPPALPSNDLELF